MEKKRFSIEELKDDIYIIDTIDGDEIDINNKEINDIFLLNKDYDLKKCCIDTYSRSISKEKLFIK